MFYLDILLPAFIIIAIWISLESHALKVFKTSSALSLDDAMDMFFSTTSNTITLIDLRSEQDFISNNIPGSINIPFDLFKRSLTHIEKGKQIILLSYTGKLAKKALRIIKKARPDLTIYYINSTFQKHKLYH